MCPRRRHCGGHTADHDEGSKREYNNCWYSQARDDVRDVVSHAEKGEEG